MIIHTSICFVKNDYPPPPLFFFSPWKSGIMGLYPKGNSIGPPWYEITKICPMSTMYWPGFTDWIKVLFQYGFDESSLSRNKKKLNYKYLENEQKIQCLYYYIFPFSCDMWTWSKFAINAWLGWNKIFHSDLLVTG